MKPKEAKRKRTSEKKNEPTVYGTGEVQWNGKTNKYSPIIIRCIKRKRFWEMPKSRKGYKRWRKIE